MFHKIDADGSGTIEIGEIYQLFKSSGMEISRDQIKALFFQKYSSTISLEEFVKAAQDEKFRIKFRLMMREYKNNLAINKFEQQTDGKRSSEIKKGKNQLLPLVQIQQSFVFN